MLRQCLSLLMYTWLRFEDSARQIFTLRGTRLGPDLTKDSLRCPMFAALVLLVFLLL